MDENLETHLSTTMAVSSNSCSNSFVFSDDHLPGGLKLNRQKNSTCEGQRAIQKKVMMNGDTGEKGIRERGGNGGW
jgi:hypothetical protein